MDKDWCFAHPQEASEEIERLTADNKYLASQVKDSEAEIRRQMDLVADLRRIQPELEANATVRGYHDGMAEIKRKLSAFNLRLS